MAALRRAPKKYSITVAAASVAMLLGGINAPADAATGGTLTVNDVSAVGKVGDDLLSLNEAIKIANGTLLLDALGTAERAQITGLPGAGAADEITLPPATDITVGLGQAVTQVRGNTGDTLDGRGSVLVPSGVGLGNGLTISSSDFTLRDFGARDFLVNVRVETGGRSLTNITLTGLRLAGGTLSDLQVGAGSSNGSLRGLKVTDSDFQGKESGSISVILAAAQPLAGAVHDVALENVLFARNTVRGGGQGLTVAGGYGLASTMTRAVTRNVSVVDNAMTDQIDAPLNIDGAIAALGSTARDVGLVGAVVERNTVEAANYGIWLGNEAIGLNVAPSRVIDGFVRNVRIADNTVVGTNPGRRWCLTLENAADFTADYNTGSEISAIVVRDNSFSNCISTVKDEIGYGISIIPGRASVFTDALGLYAPGPSYIASSKIFDVVIRDNSVTGATFGLRLIGGNATHPSVATGNALTNVSVIDNKFTTVPTGIQVIGGQGPLLSAISKNSVSNVFLSGNQVTGSTTPCSVSKNVGIGAFLNTAAATCP